MVLSSNDFFFLIQNFFSMYFLGTHSDKQNVQIYLTVKTYHLICLLLLSGKTIIEAMAGNRLLTSLDTLSSFH